MKRAALYARYSSDLQDARSIDGQFAALRAEAAKQGWQIVVEESDEEISGWSMVNRPGVQRLLSLARDGRIDVVMSEALDRIARDLGDSETIRKRLEFCGVELFTLSEGRVEMIHTALKGFMNAQFIVELGRKTKRGQALNISEGRSAGGKTYGYAPVKGEPGQLVILEDEAAIVRRVMHEYAIEQRSPLEIVKRLNADRIPGPRGRGWSESTINGEAKLGYGILHNRLYAGERVWNRQTKRKDPQTGKALMFDNPETEWKRQPCPDLRIVDDALWQAVRARHRLVSRRGGGAKRPVRLFSSVLVCGCCGGGMSIAGANAYGCSNRIQKATCDNRRTIDENVVKARVIDGLKRALLDPEAVREAARQFHETMARDQRDAARRRTTIEKELADADARIGRTVDAIAEGGPRGPLLEKLRQLEAERDRLSTGLQAFDHVSPIRLHPHAAKLYAEVVGRLADLLTSPAEGDLRQALRAIVGRIILTPRAAAKGYDMEIRGDLAGLLVGLEARNAKSPATMGGASAFPHSGTVGAGQGFGVSLVPIIVAA